MIVGKLVFDLARYSVEKTIRVKQYDREKRQLLIALLNDGEPYNIAENSTVRIECRKPDGTEILNDCTFVNNLVTAEVSEQMTTCAGIVECAISIYELDSYIASWTFNLKVDTSVITANGMTSENEYQSLIKKFNEIDTTEQELSDAIEVGNAVLEAADTLSEEIEVTKKTIDETVAEVEEAVETIKEFKDLDAIDKKLDTMAEHLEESVASEEGLHGIRYQDNTLEVKDENGDYRDVTLSFYKEEKIATLDSFDVKEISFLAEGWVGTDITVTPYSYPPGLVVVVNDVLHALGSAEGSYGAQKHYKWDESTKNWVELADMPFSVNGQYKIATEHLNELHVLYGSKHYKWNEETDTWTQLADVPQGSSQACIASYGGKLHMFGGNGSTEAQKHYIWDEETDTWTQKNNLPYACYSGVAVTYEGELHLIYLESTSGYHIKWKIATDTWENAGTLPLNGSSYQFGKAGCAVWNNKIYLAGGWNSNTSCFNHLYAFDGTSWVKEGSIYQAMGRVDLVKYKGVLILKSGYYVAGSQYFRDFKQYGDTKEDSYTEMIAIDEQRNVKKIGKVKFESIVAGENNLHTPTTNVFGNNNIGLEYQLVTGHYNNYINTTMGSSSGISGTALCIGNGTSSTRANAFRVNYNGQIYAGASAISTGADYSEYFEWVDGNEDNEDRVGYFVTFDEKQKIRKANATDDYILGIVSGLPCIIGNGDECWRGRYIYDEFGRFIEETFEYEETVINSETGEEEIITKTGTKYKENPEYNPNQPYEERAKRKEWSAIGMIGVLSVRDDGTCQENGYCTVSDGGIATACEYSSAKAYRVLERITDNIIKVLFK